MLSPAHDRLTAANAPRILLVAVQAEEEVVAEHLDSLEPWRLKWLQDKRTGDPELFAGLSGGVRWQPSRWLRLSRSDRNLVSDVLRELIRQGLLEAHFHGPRCRLVRLTDAGRHAISTPQGGDPK